MFQKEVDISKIKMSQDCKTESWLKGSGKKYGQKRRRSLWNICNNHIEESKNFNISDILLTQSVKGLAQYGSIYLSKSMKLYYSGALRPRGYVGKYKRCGDSKSGDILRGWDYMNSFFGICCRVGRKVYDNHEMCRLYSVDGDVIYCGSVCGILSYRGRFLNMSTLSKGQLLLTIDDLPVQFSHAEYFKSVEDNNCSGEFIDIFVCPMRYTVVNRIIIDLSYVGLGTYKSRNTSLGRIKDDFEHFQMAVIKEKKVVIRRKRRKRYKVSN